MDKLQECAKNFEKLLDKKYHIIIGRKGKAVDLEIVFEAVDFHHLMGLHKLKDIEALSGKREKVFENALLGNIAFSSIEKSKYFGQIENRIAAFPYLERILDNNSLIFKYNANVQTFSRIQAEYLMSSSHENIETYIFLDRKNASTQSFCRSFFPKENRDYTIGQPSYTLLFKEKLTISTGEKEVQYDRLSSSQKKTDLMLDSIPTPQPADQARLSIKEIIAAAQAEANRRNSAQTTEHQKPHKAKEIER